MHFYQQCCNNYTTFSKGDQNYYSERIIRKRWNYLLFQIRIFFIHLIVDLVSHTTWKTGRGALFQILPLRHAFSLRVKCTPAHLRQKVSVQKNFPIIVNITNFISLQTPNINPINRLQSIRFLCAKKALLIEFCLKHSFCANE